MERNRRSTAHRSELELSTLPEVAALATELTRIFNGLEITQQQYAIRTNYDKSYISRTLNGRRVAAQEFIERLLLELEKHRRTPVTEQTRARLRELRCNALKAYDPAMYNLETLRNEVDKQQRDIKRLLLHQEALEGLLERRQEEAATLRRELSQLEGDWIADRIKNEAAFLTARGESERFADERYELLEEIERLKEELRITIEQKELAEQRYASLEEQVSATEIAVAEKRERDEVDDMGLPLQYVQAKLLDADDNEIYRELSEFAFNRSSSDVADLCLWLYGNLTPEYAVELASDYCRQRPINLVVQLCLNIEEGGLEPADLRIRSAIIQIVSRRPLGDLFDFCARIVEARRISSPRSDLVPLNALVYSWLNKKRADRQPHLFDVIDYLDGLGEEKSSRLLIDRLATFGTRVMVHARIIAESGREREISIFVRAWIRKVKSSRVQFVRQMTEICEFSNSLMADLVFRDLRKFYDIPQIGLVLVMSIDLEKLQTKFTGRIAKAIVDAEISDEVREILTRNLVTTLHENGDTEKVMSPELKEALAVLAAAEGQANRRAEG